MFDYRELRVIHPHGDEWVEMNRAHHDSADHDPERHWGKGVRLFKCPTCEEQVLLVPREESTANQER